MATLDAVDLVALAIVGVTLLRGLWNGAVREAFSLAALGSACIAVRYAAAPGGAWLAERAPVFGAFAAKLAAGTAVALLVVLVVSLLGRLVRRGVRSAGLGFADRCAGGLLGAAEGAIAVALLLMLAIWLVGRDHPALASTRTLAAFERAEAIAGGELHELPSVAAPPRR